MNSNEYMDIFKDTGALLTGHFRLTSGLHSAKYFQCALVLQYPEHTTKLCRAIADVFSDIPIDTVISPAIGGIVVGQEVGRILNKKTIFTERKDKLMTLRRGFTINEGERFLICEDVVTTGGSVFEVIDVVKQNGGIPAGVGLIVDRSNGSADFNVEKQTSLFRMEVVTYQPDDCPLCKQGIKIAKPGSRITT